MERQTGMMGQTKNRELMRMARESLHGRWGMGACATLIYGVVLIAPQVVPIVGDFACVLLTGPMVLGFVIFSLALVRCSSVGVGDLFSGFRYFWKAVGAHLLVALFTFLWALLLIIPGIIASYAYAMTFYVIADNPTMSITQAIAESKAMMRGHKWKLCCLSCWFIGWGILSVLTLGIGFLWLTPYIQATMAHFYEDIRPRNAA